MKLTSEIRHKGIQEIVRLSAYKAHLSVEFGTETSHLNDQYPRLL